MIYQGLKPIYWSPYNETAIADSEIMYFDRKDPTIFVAFDVLDGKGVLTENERFVIWTTTPWTIPANLAICLNEAYDYAVVKNYAEGIWERIYYTKNDENDSIEINNRVRCYFTDITESVANW